MLFSPEIVIVFAIWHSTGNASAAHIFGSDQESGTADSVFVSSSDLQGVSLNELHDKSEADPATGNQTDGATRTLLICSAADQKPLTKLRFETSAAQDLSFDRAVPTESLASASSDAAVSIAKMQVPLCRPL